LEVLDGIEASGWVLLHQHLISDAFSGSKSLEEGRGVLHYVVLVGCNCLVLTLIEEVVQLLTLQHLLDDVRLNAVHLLIPPNLPALVLRLNSI
jgi:hypothetical protein